MTKKDIIVEANSEKELELAFQDCWDSFENRYNSWLEDSPLNGVDKEFSSDRTDLSLSNFFTDELNQRRNANTLFSKILPHLPNPANADVRPCYVIIFFSTLYTKDKNSAVDFLEMNSIVCRYSQSNSKPYYPIKGVDAWSTSDKREYVERIRQIIMSWEKYLRNKGQNRSPCLFKLEIFRVSPTFRYSPLDDKQETGTYLKYA